MLVTVLLFALGLVFLIKGGDWFVDGASGLAKKFNMPEILIGATVVSIGTTLPEVMVSSQSALTGHGEIAYGNAIGSIICNTSLIAALTVAVRPSKVNRKTLVIPVFFYFLANAFYAAVAYVKGEFSRTTGIILLIIFVIYMIITVRGALKNEGTAVQNDADAFPETSDAEDNAKLSFKDKNIDKLWFQLLLLVVGAVLIAWGADLLVDKGTLIAEGLGVPESVIALTMVALGTSLPELVTAITSLRKGCGALSLGNIIGANIFNLVLVSGLASTLSPFAVPSGKMIGNVSASLVVDIPLAFVVMTILTIPSLIKGELKRYQGVILLIIYAAFCLYQFVG